MRHGLVVFRLDEQDLAAKSRACGERAILLTGERTASVFGELFIFMHLRFWNVPPIILI